MADPLPPGYTKRAPRDQVLQLEPGEEHPKPWTTAPRPGRKKDGSSWRRRPDSEKSPGRLAHCKTISHEARVRAGKVKCEAKRRLGIPDGYRRAQVIPIREKASKEAKEIVAKMVENNTLPDDSKMAQEALEYCIGIVRAGIDRTDVRLRAANTILTFCKQKPVDKKDISVSKAEEFLQAVLDEEADGETEGN